MDTPEEGIRRQHQTFVNRAAADRATLERRHGTVWTLDELEAEFTVKQFQAPYVVVQRKSDGALGSVMFQHEPRLYFAWKPHHEA